MSFARNDPSGRVSQLARDGEGGGEAQRRPSTS